VALRPNPSIERTCHGRLRLRRHAAHFERSYDHFPSADGARNRRSPASRLLYQSSFSDRKNQHIEYESTRLQACVDTALVEKTREKMKGLGRGLRAVSVNKALTTLSAIFDKQIALRTLRFNPVTLAERMAIGSNEVGEDDELDIGVSK
jgi:hypothetical protein